MQSDEKMIESNGQPNLVLNSHVDEEIDERPNIRFTNFLQPAPVASGTLKLGIGPKAVSIDNGLSSGIKLAGSCLGNKPGGLLARRAGAVGKANPRM